MLDNLFWNTTLRSDALTMSENSASRHSHETNLVLSSGLVALSVNGNKITNIGAEIIRKSIHKNHWLLGKLVC